MNAKNYTHALLVKRTPQEVFEAIGDVAAWWTINVEGATRTSGDEFTVQFGDVHLTRQRITEAIPGRRIVWAVIESHLPWLKDVEEWKGTEIVFEIAAEKKGTRLTMTHVGLTPSVECFDQCEKGWDYFIGTSLLALLTDGAGLPDTTERTHMDSIGHVHARNT